MTNIYFMGVLNVDGNVVHEDCKGQIIAKCTNDCIPCVSLSKPREGVQILCASCHEPLTYDLTDMRDWEAGPVAIGLIDLKKLLEY